MTHPASPQRVGYVAYSMFRSVIGKDGEDVIEHSDWLLLRDSES